MTKNKFEKLHSVIIICHLLLFFVEWCYDSAPDCQSVVQNYGCSYPTNVIHCKKSCGACPSSKSVCPFFSFLFWLDF